MEIVPDTAFFSPHVRDVLHHFRFKLRFHAFLRRQLGGHKTRVHTMLLFIRCPSSEKHLFRNPKSSGERPLKKWERLALECFLKSTCHVHRI